MDQHKIEWIRPKDNLPFISCYYNGLFIVLTEMGVEKDDIILNDYVEIKEDFGITKKKVFSDRKHARRNGYKRFWMKAKLKSIFTQIKKGNAILAGVDCFYLSNRLDTYNIMHSMHFVIVLGFDKRKGVFYIIDHNYQNSLEYVEKEISIDDLLVAMHYYEKNFSRNKKSCVVIKERRIKRKHKPLRIIGNFYFKQNEINSKRNLIKLKEWVQQGGDCLEKNTEKIYLYLLELKKYYITLSKIDYISLNEENRVKVARLIADYINLLAIFMKLHFKKDFSFISKNQQYIVKKIDSIIECEKSIYNVLMEGVYEWV